MYFDNNNLKTDKEGCREVSATKTLEDIKIESGQHLGTTILQILHMDCRANSGISETISLRLGSPGVDSGLAKPLSSEHRTFTHVKVPVLEASGCWGDRKQDQFHGQLQLGNNNNKKKLENNPQKITFEYYNAL